jgi:hypothetical protein
MAYPYYITTKEITAVKAIAQDRCHLSLEKKKKNPNAESNERYTC